MALPASAFNRRITILRAGPAIQNTLNEEVPGPDIIVGGAPVWASRLNQGRRERLGAAQINAAETTLFTVRYSLAMAGVMTTDRLQYKGIVYNINAVQERGQREEIDIYVEGLIP